MCSCPGDCEGAPECLDDEGGPLPARDTRPFAVCAPGNRLLAALVLALHGEQVSEVRESRFLEGKSEVYVCTPPEFPVYSPEAFRISPSPEEMLAEMRADRERKWLLARAMPFPPSPVVVLSGIC